MAERAEITQPPQLPTRKPLRRTRPRTRPGLQITCSDTATPEEEMEVLHHSININLPSQTPSQCDETSIVADPDEDMELQPHLPSSTERPSPQEHQSDEASVVANQDEEMELQAFLKKEMELQALKQEMALHAHSVSIAQPPSTSKYQEDDHARFNRTLSIPINESSRFSPRSVHVLLPLSPECLNKPSSFYLSEDQRENYMKICVPLYNAAVKGDWHAAEGIIRACPKNVINMSITRTEDTLLHIVASTKHTHFAKNLVKMMKAEDLELQNRDGETALWLAVASTVKMVDVLLEKNNGLLKIRKKGDLPFLCAVWFGDKDMVEYIFAKTNLADEKWTESDQKRILSSCLAFGLLEIALKIIKHCKTEGLLTIDTDVLRNLANKPSAFDGTVRPIMTRLMNKMIPGPGPSYNSKAVEIVRIMWGEIVKQKHEDILKLIAGDQVIEKLVKERGYPYYDTESVDKITYPNRLLFTAARLGNYKFIIELLKLYPDITWDRDENEHTIFHVAVIHRQENVYNLIYELGSKKLGYMRDNNGNNILHLAATKPMQSRVNIVSGAALQMQRELLWFKEVETILSSVERTRKNKQGKSPQELFTDEHTELMDKGESWMKETAAQCMVVAALIATMMFAAAYTLPGGSNGDNGQPIFKNKSAFTVFVVTDAISLCTSSASILMFLAILTSRYTERDFLVSLPVKLMVGLVTLFISIATMMIAFTASFFLVYAKSMKWIPGLVTALAGVPVILFAVLQYRLFVDMISSTFNSRHVFRPKKHILV